ncbi:hypothetical protein RRG08_026330 [Elysia crispata]|uniref:RHD domain-containing protein n=1 Tax=Elysia crispata TaxID=231223 RepID=A0AAE0ZAN2_9GAST|nr:hypothetical protein RRG08_026330 [Elysia crispata]
MVALFIMSPIHQMIPCNEARPSNYCIGSEQRSLLEMHRTAGAVPSTLRDSKKARLLRRHMASLSIEAKMNSPIKDALNDFIKSNTAAVEKAMENGEEHDLAKSEPTIPDLVNYLSYPTPQPGPKDGQPMSLEDKAPIHDSNFNPAQQTQQSQNQQKMSPFASGNPSQSQQSAYCSPAQDHQQQQLSQPGDGNHFGTSGESSFGAGGGSSQPSGVSASNASPQPQHQHQFLQQHHSHYGQNSTFYPSQHSPADVIGNSNINTSANAENMVFADIQGSDASVYAHNSNTAANSSNLNNSNAQPTLTDQFQHSVQVQHHNPVVSFQNQAQVNSNSFQSNAVLPSAFTQSSSNTHLQFNSSSNSLSFEKMTLASQGTIGPVEGARDQFEPTEKMHIDEPVSGYTNPGNATQNLSHFQQQTFQSKSNSMEIGFNGENFSGGNAGFSIEQFDSSLVDKSSSSIKDYGNKVQTVDTNVPHNTAAFELPNNPYRTQPVTGGFEASQFSSQTFTQDASITHQNQQLNIGEFQPQPNSNQNSVGLSLHTGQYVPPESAQAQQISNQGQQGFGNNAEISFQGTGFQETSSPIGNSASSSMTENFHVQASNIDSPHAPNYSNQSQIQPGNSSVEGQQFQSHISHQPSPKDEQQYTASPQSNNSDAGLVLSPDYSSVAFQSNVSSPKNFGGQFSSQQQQHEQRQQQQSGQDHPQHNFLNNVPQQQTPVLGNNDNFITQSVNDVASQQTQLAINATLQYHSSSVNQGQVADNSVKSSGIDAFPGANNTQFSPQTSFTTSADTFAQLDLESLASEDYSVKSSVTSDQVSQKNQNFNYQFSNTNSHTASHSVAEGTQANFSFSQNEKNMLSGADSQNFEATSSRSAEQASTFQAHSAEIHLRTIQNASQESSEKYPQPMQVQENVFAKVQDSNGQLAYQAPTSRIGETEMDTSTGMADKSQTITSGISYEEIHHSIVEAGKEFSRKAADAGTFSQQKSFAGPGVQQKAGNSASTSLSCHGSQGNMFLQNDAQVTKTEAIFISHAQTSPLTSSVLSSSSFAPQSPHNVNLQKISPGSNFNLQTEHSLFSSLLSNMQTSSSAAGPELSTQISSQVFPQLGNNEAAPIVTMPNFLENPGVMLSCIRSSNPENVSMLSPMSFNKPEQTGLLGANNAHMVMTMIAASPVNSLPAVAKSGTDHPKMAAISSQNQMQQSFLSLASVIGVNPQLINSHISFASSPSITGTLTATHAQPQQQQLPVSLSIFNQMSNQQSQAQIAQGSGLIGARSDSMPAINVPNGVEFQAMPSKTDPKSTALTLGVQSSSPKQVNNSAPQTIGGVLPAGTTAVVGGQKSMSQPHIIITFEDLKKLLTQRNSALSPTPSEAKPMDQSTPSVLSTTSSSTLVSSAPTLVLQSSASSSHNLVQPLIQHPPRLFLNSPPRFMHPHEQLQQTREKLQQLEQQTQQSQTFPTGFPAHKNQEHKILFASEESNNQKRVQTSILAIQQDQQANHKLQMQVLEQQKQHIQEQFHRQQQQNQQNEQQQLQQQQTILSLKHTQETLQNMLFTKKDQACTDTKLPPLQLPCGQPGQRLVIQQSQLMQVADQKVALQSSQSPRVLNLGQVQQELQALKSVTAPQKEQDKKLQQSTEKVDRSDRLCSDSLKKDYKHLHSLLTMESSSGGPVSKNAHSKVIGQAGQTPDAASNSHISITRSSSQSKLSPSATSISNSASSAFSFMPLSTAPPLSLSSSCSTFLPAAKEGFSFKATASSFPPPTSGFALSSHASSAPLTTLAFTNAHFTSAFSKVSEIKEPTDEASISSNVISSLSSPPYQDSDLKESEMATDVTTEANPRQGSILAQILTESKRSHTPLSVDLSSPGNSNSEAPSPLSSPNPYEDSNTQLTLVERSAGLHIKSDTMHGIDDDDEGDDTYSDSLYKRPSTEESRASGETDPDVPMKIAKASTSMDARSSMPTPSSPEPAFDIGSVVSSASNFSFAFGNKDETGSELFTFGSSTTSCSTSDSNILRRSPKPLAGKPVPTQSVRPTARKQKEYGLKAYYPSKCEDMELKILEQPETQHRARYQTEGSRGAIKDISQQGFPVIKLNGYQKQTKLQIYIGDESTRVKPHGFYQACRVFGKNSTPCTEQEIEGTAIIEIDLTPENDMTAKLDCIGILKLRNADVERRIGPKRARDKKKNNTRARLVLRCLVERQNSHGELMLQTVSNPIVCTQPVGQPEICRMSLTESSVEGGESLFIIGKNFKNKGTTVSFQMLDPSDESVVQWQAGAEIEQEFFQPTHLICKIPQFMDRTVQKPKPVQIVVSCAGKKSDPHKFTYLPEVKQEMPMETENISSSRSLPIVSPEALQLNHMVHQSHALSSGSHTIFQLPPGAVPTVETQTSNVLRAKPSSTQEASALIKPARLVISNNASDVSQALSWSPAIVTLASATSNSSLLSQVALPSKQFGGNSNLTPTTQVGLPSFLLDDKPDGMVHEGLNQAKQGSANHNQDTSFSCIVHSTSRTQPIPSPSHTVSSGHVGTVLTSSAHGSSGDTTAASTEMSQNAASTPIVLVLNPAALQNGEGGESIQQLFQQLLNSQNSKGCFIFELGSMVKITNKRFFCMNSIMTTEKLNDLLKLIYTTAVSPKSYSNCNPALGSSCCRNKLRLKEY